MVCFSNGQFYSSKMVQTGPEIKLPFDFLSRFQMAIQKPDYFVYFSNGYNKMVSKMVPYKYDWFQPILTIQKPDFSGFQMFTACRWVDGK
jgi:hypothetical protein